MDTVILSLTPVLLGYLLGSIPFAFLLARRAGGLDLRQQGSGNVGAANVFRTTGPGVALAVVALDVTKGAASVLVARGFGADATPAAAGLAAIIGHIYPVWLGFRGGKGVAAACGVFFMLAPLAAAASGVVFFATVWLTRYVSLGSVLAAALLAPLAYLTDAGRPVTAASAIAAAVIIERHRSNLARLQAGTERRLGQRA